MTLSLDDVPRAVVAASRSPRHPWACRGLVRGHPAFVGGRPRDLCDGAGRMVDLEGHCYRARSGEDGGAVTPLRSGGRRVVRAPAEYLAWAPWGTALGDTPRRALGALWRKRKKGARRAAMWVYSRPLVLSFLAGKEPLIHRG